MSIFNSAKSRSFALTATFVGAAALAAPATASADAIDDALNAIPAGQISCAQASKYWTTEADYNSKVSQANALALFDSRGPQIKAALARVDEAANRCGLKGGTTNTGATGATGGNADTTNNTPAPAAAAPVASFAPAGTPSYTVQVPGVGGVQLPDLYQIVKQFLAQFGINI
ncbi:hypothetical protein [Corynebacterium callunae]|uniref:Secreted protein n=1 Tax=Corynebacterium callunae DSM 20147 TaxID=1121353 RepID=M1TMK7_9CORY|nr:hypothetical protein [Corynebacterium callunae]AGG65561.1 hypothetical protein H924_00505 [Corynebacterium callunae DSM 20147]